MNRITTALAAAVLACGMPSAQAAKSLVDKLDGADDALKNVAPQFVCYDQTDPKTCQQLRFAFSIRSGGNFWRSDFSDGHHHLCFSPGHNSPYRVCNNNSADPRGEVFTSKQWILVPTNDPRCSQWGGPLTAEYLACEAALPPKQEGENP